MINKDINSTKEKNGGKKMQNKSLGDKKTKAEDNAKSNIIIEDSITNQENQVKGLEKKVETGQAIKSKKKKEIKKLVLNKRDKKILDYGIKKGYLSIDIISNTEKVNINFSRLGTHILEIHKFINTEITTGVDSLLLYKDGYLQIQESEQIKSLIRKYLPSEIETIKTVNEVFEKIKTECYIPRFSEQLKKIDDKFLNVNNGLIDLETFNLEPHSFENASITRFNVNYEPEKIKELKNSRFIKFINECTNGEEQKEKISLLQELTGYNITTWNMIKEITIISGKKDTGKSVFLSILTNLIPSTARTAFKLQEINKETHLAMMATSRVNIFPDLTDKPIEDTDGIKVLSGGGIDGITGRHLFKKPFEFRPYTKQMYSCNKIPSINKCDNAFVERLILIKFNNIAKNKDLTLSQKLENEKDLIFLWIIEGIKRLKANNYILTETVESKELVDEYKINNSTVNLFINDCIEIVPDENIFISDLYKHYVQYCSETGIPSRAKNNFREEFEEILNIKKHSCIRVKGCKNPSTGYKNVRCNMNKDAESKPKLQSLGEITAHEENHFKQLIL